MILRPPLHEHAAEIEDDVAHAPVRAAPFTLRARLGIALNLPAW